MGISRRWVCVLILLVSVCMLLCAGAQAGPAEDPAGREKLDYRLADRSEGTALMMANEAYYAGFTQNDLDYRMQKTGASMAEYQAFAREQVLDFTDEQKALIDTHMRRIREIIAERGYHIPALDEIIFVSTTMQEECDAMAYTHGTQIYMDGSALIRISTDTVDGARRLDYIFAHELFHCITRCSPDFRAAMYRIIHFTVQAEDFTLPPSAREYFISNPDVEHHNAYATFVIGGEPIDCFTAFVTTKHFEKKGDRFFDSATTALIPTDGTDTYYVPEDAANFDEVFGTNTGYVVDPEECLADNFGYLIAYGMNGPDGMGYPNPEIITSIEELLITGGQAGE